MSCTLPHMPPTRPRQTPERSAPQCPNHSRRALFCGLPSLSDYSVCHVHSQEDERSLRRRRTTPGTSRLARTRGSSPDDRSEPTTATELHRGHRTSYRYRRRRIVRSWRRRRRELPLLGCVDHGAAQRSLGGQYYTPLLAPAVMQPQLMRSKAAIARLRAYKPPPFPLWDRLPLSRRAAVLMLLYADRRGDLRAVITMRAASLRSFSGHAALPGGKADTLDETACSSSPSPLFPPTHPH